MFEEDILVLFCFFEANNPSVTVTLTATAMILKTSETEFSGAQGLSQNKENEETLGLCFCRAVRIFLPGVAIAKCIFPLAESGLVLLQVHHGNHKNIQKPARKLLPLLNLLDIDSGFYLQISHILSP